MSHDGAIKELIEVENIPFDNYELSPMKKGRVLFGICLVGLAVVPLSAIRLNAQGDNCDLTQTTLTKVVAVSSIPLVKGQVVVDVDNPSPFITGMRVRVMSGTSLANTKYVEGQIGLIQDCTVAINVDLAVGSGAIQNGRFSVAGVRGVSGPRGPRGAMGLTGLRGPTGASGTQGIQGMIGATGPQGAQGQTGATGPQGAQGIQGPVGPFGSFGSFYDTSTQALVAINTPQAMVLNEVTPGSGGVIANGVSVVDGSKVYVEDTGVYNIQFSAQIAKSDAGTDTMDIWLAVDGQAVPWTNTTVTIDTAKRYVAAWNFMIQLNANQYFQLFFSSADIAMSLLAVPPQTGPTRPGIPSVIITATQVS